MGGALSVFSKQPVSLAMVKATSSPSSKHTTKSSVLEALRYNVKFG